jgi:DNA-damage-inducible protein J
MDANTKRNDTLQVRISNDTKKQTEAVLKELGLSMKDAINIYFRQIINTNSIPFIIQTKTPNKETLQAMQEVEDMISGKIKPKTKSIKELFAEVKNEN